MGAGQVDQVHPLEQGAAAQHDHAAAGAEGGLGDGGEHGGGRALDDDVRQVGQRTDIGDRDAIRQQGARRYMIACAHCHQRQAGDTCEQVGGNRLADGAVARDGDTQHASGHPAPHGGFEERRIRRVDVWIAGTMAPDTGDRVQFGVCEVVAFRLVVGDAKIQVGRARQQ